MLFRSEKLTAGSHTIGIFVKDEAGNEVNEEHSFVVEKIEEPEPDPDITPPELNVIVEMPEDFKLGDTIIIKTTATDDNSIPLLTVMVNGQELIGEGGVYEFTPSESGKYTIEVTATDEAGNWTKETYQIEIEEPEEPEEPVEPEDPVDPDITPPELKVTIPEDRTISIGETLTFKGQGQAYHCCGNP